MTQPVQEPTPERDVGGLAWQARQLARRPTSAGGSSPKRPWIELDATGQDFDFDQDVTLLTTDLYWDSNLVTLNPADPADGSDDMFAIDTATYDGTDYWTMSNRHEGWFTVEFGAYMGQLDNPSANDASSWLVALFPTPNFGGGFNERCCPFYLAQDLPTTAIATGTGEFLASRGQLWGYRTFWCAAQRDWSFWAHCYNAAANGPSDLSGYMKIWWEMDAFGGDPDNNNWEFATP